MCVCVCVCGFFFVWHPKLIFTSSPKNIDTENVKRTQCDTHDSHPPQRRTPILNTSWKCTNSKLNLWQNLGAQTELIERKECLNSFQSGESSYMGMYTWFSSFFFPPAHNLPRLSNLLTHIMMGAFTSGCIFELKEGMITWIVIDREANSRRKHLLLSWQFHHLSTVTKDVLWILHLPGNSGLAV